MNIVPHTFKAEAGGWVLPESPTPIGEVFVLVGRPKFCVTKLEVSNLC